MRTTSPRLAIVLGGVLLLATACGQSSQPASSEAVESEPAASADTETEEATTEPSAEPATVTYWHTMSDAETAQLEKVVAAFEDTYPHITVETTRYAYDDFKSALLTGIAGGQPPDTARLDIIWVPEFAEQGALLALDDKMEGFDEIASSAFPGPLSTNFWNGSYYGLPQNTNTQVLLWNRERFEEAGLDGPPDTLEEFPEVVCQLSDQGAERYGYAMGGTYFWAPAPIFYAMGGQIVDDEITTADGYINGEASVAAFEMLTELYNDGCLSPSVLGGGVGTADGLATDVYATIVDGPWMVDIYKGNHPDFEVNFALIPAGPDGTTSSVVGGENVVVFASTKSEDAAVKWAQYLMSEDAQRTMAEVGMIPTIAGLADDPAMPDYFDVFMEQLETAQARVPHPKWSDMDTAINEAFQRMLRGDMSVQEALDQAAEQIDQLLQ